MVGEALLDGHDHQRIAKSHAGAEHKGAEQDACCAVHRHAEYAGRRD
ncbi:MAG: hypothetical protein NTZ81_02210 [Actinobacteria bacterium]|nr:hypothetical protein [Actinomycetota bacterium]